MRENEIMANKADITAAEYGTALRRARYASGLTQMQLEEKTGIKYARIAGYEIGRRTPDEKTKAILNEALGVNKFLADGNIRESDTSKRYESQMRKQRRARGMTQKELASRIGIRQNRYALFEEEIIPLTKDTAEKVAEALGLTIGELIPGDMKTWQDYADSIRTKNHRIGNAVRRIRENRGIGKEQFSEMLGISVHYLDLIESGTKGISKLSLVRMTKCLRCSEEDITGNQE